MGTELDDLRDHAERCRRLSQIVADERNKRQLVELAVQLDEQADKLQSEEAERNASVKPSLRSS